MDFSTRVPMVKPAAPSRRLSPCAPSTRIQTGHSPLSAPASLLSVFGESLPSCCWPSVFRWRGVGTLDRTTGKEGKSRAFASGRVQSLHPEPQRQSPE